MAVSGNVKSPAEKQLALWSHSAPNVPDVYGKAQERRRTTTTTATVATAATAAEAATAATAVMATAEAATTDHKNCKWVAGMSSKPFLSLIQVRCHFVNYDFATVDVISVIDAGNSSTYLPELLLLLVALQWQLLLLMVAVLPVCDANVALRWRHRRWLVQVADKMLLVLLLVLLLKHAASNLYNLLAVKVEYCF